MAQRHQRALIVASSKLAHVEAGCAAMQLAANGLGAGHKCGWVIEKVDNVMLFIGQWMLVGNEPDGQVSPVALALDHFPQYLFLVDAHRVEALPQL